MDLGIEGHAILVTGASGGIGTAIARALAAEGEIGGVALQADLRDEEQADALVPAAVQALGRLDSCVANAGVWPGEDVTVSQMPLERWRATNDANLTAAFLT